VRKTLEISLKPMNFTLEIPHREKYANQLATAGNSSVSTGGFSAAC
jgi:hypothetical protein